MYIYNNKIYSDAYKYLVCNNAVGFQFIEGDEVTELDIIIDDLHIVGNKALYNNNQFVQLVNPNYTYSDYKSAIIKKRYSNDDQIAIMLNKDESEKDLLRFNKMQEWRQFASDLAHKLIEMS